MRSIVRMRWLASIALSVLFVLTATNGLVRAQGEDSFGDAGADPVKLFERGQAAHARGDLAKALDLYDQAIKVRPEFPEAEFQRGNALAALGRVKEAEEAFRKAIELKKNWSLPYSALGTLLIRDKRDAAAETAFRQALTIDANDNVALRFLSDIRLRAGDTKGALELAKRATANPDSPSSAWIGLAAAQRASGDKAGARATLDRVLSDDATNIAALIERADLQVDELKYDGAIADLKAASKSKPDDKQILTRLVYVYQQAGKSDEAAAIAKAAGLQLVATGDNKKGVIGNPDEIEAANSEDPTIARKALEKLLEKNPNNAMLLSRLGASYRTDDPARSLDYFRHAAEIDPKSAEYALGYASALVQARRFQEAAHILRQVVKLSPQNYPAHANLATALYELKLYRDALPEYEWLLAAKPDTSVAYYFIGTAHDYLGEFPEALSSYETFLIKANAATNQLEIDKVKLRLPSLRRQIQLGEGVKKKP
jgi:protein O-GlcNAc transferase